MTLFVGTTAGRLAGYDSDFKVPVLIDGDLVVWDSLAILEYVSETYLEDRCWHEDRKARSVARSVSSEMHSGFFHMKNELPMNCRQQHEGIRLSREAESEIARIKGLWKKCRYGRGRR